MSTGNETKPDGQPPAQARLPAPPPQSSPGQADRLKQLEEENGRLHAELFRRELEELCQRHGVELAPTPQLQIVPRRKG